MDESKRLATFLSGLRYEDLKSDLVERAKALVLDQLGVELATSTTPQSMALYKYVRGWGGPAESTIVHYGDKAKAENVAFLNASFGHGFELDDTYLLSGTHPGAISVPSALAFGERDLIDGRTFLLSVITGYEAMGRISCAVAPSYWYRGFDPITVSGPFGAAATIGKILGFSPELMLHALSIAASHSSGIMEYAQAGGNVKRMHAGMAAFGGIRAALLAQIGFTGPPTILEGKSGFCRAFADDYRLEDITANLGHDFVVMGMSFKRHCACYQIQAPIDATSKIVGEHGLRAGDIEEVLIGTNSVAIPQVGTIYEPQEIAAAQFSAPFSVAMAVIKGRNGFRDYTEENLKDPDIKAFARKVRLVVDDEIQAMFPQKRAVRVTVRLKNGTTFQEKLDGARGTPVNPMSRTEVEDKFRDLATVVLPGSRVEEIIQVVEALDEVKSLSVLSRLLIA
jgi:2-methylcitrate dehydratase PrpD